MSGWFTGEGARLPSILMLVFLLALVLIGSLFVHSATLEESSTFPTPMAKRHLARVAAGLALMFFFIGVHHRYLERCAGFLYGTCVAVLVGLLIYKAANGIPVMRWIRLPGLGLQPSEIMKLVTVFMLAVVLRPRHRPLSGWSHLLPLAVALVPALLVALQPDMGTALMFMAILVGMLWVSGISTRRLVAYGSVGLCAVPVIWFFFMHDYQKSRVQAFLFPNSKTVAESGLSYQIDQSLIAIGSGGPTGKGFARGPQNTLEVLPEEHNDFIFGVIGEEWGLVGTLTVTLLFLGLFLCCCRVADRARDPFGRLVAAGITVWLAFQTFVNLAMTIGLAPVTGLPLPFVSFGGSSLLSCLAAMGVVLGIGMRPGMVMTSDGLTQGSAAHARRPVIAPSVRSRATH